MLKSRHKGPQVSMFIDSNSRIRQLKTLESPSKQLDNNLNVQLPEQSMVNIKFSGKHHLYAPRNIVTEP